MIWGYHYFWKHPYRWFLKDVNLDPPTGPLWFVHLLPMDCFNQPTINKHRQNPGYVLKKGGIIYVPRWWQLKHFLFPPRNPGEMIQIDEHIFQLGWFNHQPVTHLNRRECVISHYFNGSGKLIAGCHGFMSAFWVLKIHQPSSPQRRGPSGGPTASSVSYPEGSGYI